MKAQYDKSGLKANNRIPELVNNNELAYLASSVCGDDTAFFAAAAVVVIVAAAIVTYVAVGVNVAAGLNVGVYLSVVTKVAVATSGAAAMPASAARITTSQNGWLYNAVNNADIPDLTTVGYDSLMTAAKISKMSGDTALNHLTVNEIIKREIDTAIKAAEDSGMLHIHPSQRDNVIQAATSYTLRVMGVKN